MRILKIREKNKKSSLETLEGHMGEIIEFIIFVLHNICEDEKHKRTNKVPKTRLQKNVIFSREIYDGLSPYFCSF